MSIEIRITLDKNGVRVEGPIQDKLLCFGLLEAAKDVVRSYDPAEAPRVIIPVVAQ